MWFHLFPEAIYELSGIDYLKEHLKLTLSRDFEIFEKYYVCVLNLLPNTVKTGY